MKLEPPDDRAGDDACREARPSKYHVRRATRARHDAVRTLPGPNVMRVGDVMTRGVETTTAGATLQAAALVMREAGVGMLPVMEGPRPVGVVTDRDITVRATANGLDPKTTHVSDVMTRSVVYCAEDASPGEAAQLMENRTIRRLLVLDRDGRMVGVVALDDLAMLEAEDRAGPVAAE